MTLGIIVGILLILTRHEYYLGIAVCLMGVNGDLLMYLYSKEKTLPSSEA